MRAAIINYGAGNLHSIAKAVEFNGFETSISPDISLALNSDVVILPGVGAFGLASEALASGMKILRSALSDGFPCVTICLGMQLLFESSEEGEGQGIGFLQGRVRRLESERAPQIGWNAVKPEKHANGIFDGFDLAYYANTYVCEPLDESVVIARTEYDGESFPAAIRNLNTIGVQFHPEKSSRSGVELLGRLLREVTR